jgi:hypothetical protein
MEELMEEGSDFVITQSGTYMCEMQSDIYYKLDSINNELILVMYTEEYLKKKYLEEYKLDSSERDE